MKEKRGHGTFAVLEYVVELEDADQTEHLGKGWQELQKPFPIAIRCVIKFQMKR